ncbi:response regulator [bacterium]|nr:response regulator [bacterium]MBU3956212.1 response regulator [bacterium]MBU4134122.1 response regulator [bacterium]
MSKILIVEDDPDAREILCERLKSYGFEVEEAENGWAGIEKLKKYKADLIIMDIMMPKLDGYTACKIIREDSKTSKVPIIFLTAKELIGEIEKAFACGADDYVIKPVTWERLLPKIKKFLP